MLADLIIDGLLATDEIMDLGDEANGDCSEQ